MSRGSILYIGGFELPDKNAAAHRVLGNAKVLRELGYEVDLLGVSKSMNEDIDVMASVNYYDEFRYWSIPYPSKTITWVKYVSSIRNIKVILSNSKKEYDGIIIYNFPGIASYQLLKYCNKRDIKIIADCTEWYDYRKNSIMGIIKYLDSEFRMKYINNRVDGLICISEYLYKYYKKVKNKVILTPLVDLQDKKWEIENSNQRNNQKIKLIYAGSPGLTKDKINLVIDSLAKIENTSNRMLLNIIGITKDEYFNNYPEQDIKRKLIEKFTIFNGRIPHIDAVELIKESDFSIFLREKTRANMAGFPTKFVEAISCGTPVLTNKTSDLGKYLIYEQNGFWLNIENDSERIKELDKIIKLSRTKIDEMKKHTKLSRMFDYSQQINSMDIFISKII